MPPRTSPVVEDTTLGRAVEWFVALTTLVADASHVLQPTTWMETVAALHRLGKPGAFANGALGLVPGAAIVTAHPVWTWPAVPQTLFGWPLVTKGAIYLLLPEVGVRSMARSPSRNRFTSGGAVLMAIGAWAAYCAAA